MTIRTFDQSPAGGITSPRINSFKRNIITFIYLKFGQNSKIEVKHVCHFYFLTFKRLVVDFLAFTVISLFC